MRRTPNHAPTERARPSSNSAWVALRLLGPALGNLIVRGRVLAAHNGPNPGERDIATAEVILFVLLLGGILLAAVLSKQRRPRIRKRRLRLK